jgi:hypothetical protein
MALVPLYGFLEGDTLGILILSHHNDSVREVIQKLRTATQVRVALNAVEYDLYIDAKKVSLDLTVFELGLKPLDKVDVRIRPSL